MKLLLVDDHALFRAGLALLVREIMPEAQVLHAGSCAEGIAIASREALNLIFLDVSLPDGNGLEALAAMKAARPSVPVVVVTGSADRATAERAIALNAMGVVLKSASSEEMLAAIAPAMAGGVSLPESLLGGTGPVGGIGGFAGARDAGAGAGSRHNGAGRLTPITDAAALGLTPRQFEVLRLLVQGHPNKIIARQMDISLQGAKKHVSDLLAHFQVMSRSQLIVLIAQRRYALGTPSSSDPANELADE